MRSGTSISKGWLKFLYMAGALLTACSFFVSLETSQPAESHIRSGLLEAFYKLFEQLGETFSGHGFVILVLFAALSFLYNSLMTGKLEKAPAERGLAAFFAVMYTAGVAFRFNDSLSSLRSPAVNVLKSLMIFGGFFFLYLLAIRLFHMLMVKKNELDFEFKRFKGIRSLYNSHPFAFMWVVIMLSWSIHLIMRFPGAMSADNWAQLMYYYGKVPYSSWQPIFHTWLTGTFINFGHTVLGSANAGLFIYVLIQALSMSAVLAYTLLFMKRWNAPRWLRVFTIVLYCVTPYFAGNAAWAIKDYYYLIGTILWTMSIVEFTPVYERRRNEAKVDDTREKAAISARGTMPATAIRWTLGATLMILFRNNGIYMFVATTLVMGIAFLVRLCKHKERFSFVYVLMAVIPLLINTGVSTAIDAAYDVQPGSVGEALSLPIQQTARYVCTYEDEVTDEEKEAISKAIAWEELFDYSPDTSDSTKSGYRAQTTEDLVGYLKIWFKMFFKHPMCYVEATWNQNYYLFMPDFDSIKYNQDCDNGKANATDDLKEELDIHVPDAVQGMPIVICSWYRMLNVLPITSTMNNTAVYVMIMVAITIFLWKKKLGRYNIALLPVWLAFFFVVLGPAVYLQPRYSWPIIYIVPTLVAMYMRLLED